MNKKSVRLRRIYEAPKDADGVRVLVDRVWPRGVSKTGARLDAWMKDVAPSTQLRKWYSHDPGRFAEFTRRYLIELKDAERAAALAELRQLSRHRTVTLLTATKAVDISQAAVLADVTQ